jgi:replicative DNA helicase
VDVDAIKLPPHSVEAEQSVLGALLLKNAAIDQIEDKVAPADFYSEAHRAIYRGIRGLVLTGKPADVVTLSVQLRNDGELERVGGMDYLGSLVANVPTAANIEHYAGIVRDRAMLRALAAFAMDAGDLAMTRTGVPALELVEEVQRRAGALSDGHAGPDATPIGDLLPHVIESIEKRFHDQEPVGINTGLVDLDAKLCGLQAGDLVIVAGRPSMGKTSLAMQFGIHAASGESRANREPVPQLPVLVFSLEMNPDRLAERAVAHISRVNSYGIRSGKLSPDDWSQIATGLGRLQEIPLYIDGSPRLNVERMRARARRLQRARGLGLVIVDYLQLMEGDGDGRNEQVSGISRGLKLMANELKVPVIALSQLSRKCEERTDKRPMLSDLRDSGAVEQDADIVLFVYRDEVYYPHSEAKGTAEIIIGKNRDGEVGRVYATFLGSYNRFENSAWHPTAPSSSRKSTRKRPDLDDDDA